MNKTELRKALDTIALKHGEGVVSNDVLIKACQNYKDKIEFKEDLDYDLIVAKSLFDALNNVAQDQEIIKAIIPGQTKVVDGVMYIYSATKNGSKTEYGWHVVKKGSKTNTPVGRGKSLTTAQITAKQKYINDLFPKDLSTLKVVKRLGGSTGAVLVEDVNGNQYVMKTGANTSNEHVKSEYYANQIYSALGQRTPDYEMYEDDKGNVTLLSRFIPMTHAPKQSDAAELAKGWIADCLLANWDVYQNDNCLIDSSGRVFRVDNGGCLAYRAQGQLKNPPFDGDVLKTYKDMMRYNQSVFSQLDEEDLLKQIQAVKAKRDTVLDYLRNSGQDALADIMQKRFDNLKVIEDYLNKQVKAKNRTVLPRTLKDASEMYADIDEDVLDDIWSQVAKKLPGYGNRSVLNNQSSNGWEILSLLCQQRGFDARPRVVDEDEFWKFAATAKHPIMFRGQSAGGGQTGQYWCDEFRYSDDCFYGTMGIYGQGIYAHVDDTNSARQQGKSKNNHSTKASYQSTAAWSHAQGYSNGGGAEILKLAYENDVKIADLQDLIREIKSNPPTGGKTTAKAKSLQKELDDISEELRKTEDNLNNISDVIKQDVYTRMSFNETSYSDMLSEIENTDWGARDADGNPDYPDWNTFVVGKMIPWITAQGGSVKQEPDSVTFRLPHSSSVFTLSRYTYETNAIKQKNTFTRPYSYPVQRFEQWVTSQHATKVQNALEHAKKHAGDRIKDLTDRVSQLKNDYKKKDDELQEEIRNNAPQALYAAIYNEMLHTNPDAGSGLEAVGIYAVLKGYDGIYRNNGNGGENGFAVILNRSKIVVSKK